MVTQCSVCFLPPNLDAKYNINFINFSITLRGRKHNVLVRKESGETKPSESAERQKNNAVIVINSPGELWWIDT